MANTFNHNDKVVITDGGSVGIGTTTPGSTFTSIGTIQTSRNANETENLLFYSQATAKWGSSTYPGVIESYGNNSMIIGSGQNVPIYIARNGSIALTVGGGGKIGIGTTSPDGPLHVVGSSGNVTKIYYDLLLYNTISFTDANWNIQSRIAGVSSDMRFYTNGSTETMRITSSGNVGIGTTSPSYKLDVYGSARIGGSNGDVDLVIEADADNSGENDNPRLILKQDGGLVNGIIGLNGDANNAFTGALSNGMYIYAYDALQLRGGSGGIVTIDGNGNVGINTTSPSKKLHVLGQTRFDSYSLSDPDTTSIGNYPAAHTFTYYSEANGMFIVGGQGSYTGTTLTIGQETNASSSFNHFRVIADTNGTPATQFVIRGDGNVGIGTDSPTDKLHIAGNISIGTSYKIYTGSASNSAGLDFGNSYFKASGYNGIIFYSSTDGVGSQSERMRITNTGNVGIGTTSPDAKLSIISTAKGIHIDKGSYSSTSSNLSECRTNYAFAYDTLRNGSTTGFFITNASTNVPAMQAVDSSNNAQNISIQPYGGNVGIGTTSPQSGYKLDVRGNILAYYANVVAQGLVSGYGLSEQRIGPDGTSASSKPFIVYTSGGFTNERLRIDTSGNVGIGTTSPQTKLEVDGSTNSFVAHFGQGQDNGDGSWGGISVGYGETSNSLYRKVGIVAEAHGDGAARQHLHFLVDTVSDANSATLSDSKMMIDGFSGNVGIGTTSPSHKLQVQNGNIGVYSDSYGNTGMIRLFGTDNSEKLQIGSLSSNGFLYSPDGIGLSIYTGGSENVRITSGGNVGIGTTSPVTGLDVRTSAYSNTTARFGETRPVYIVNNDPIIGFNQYYDNGWKAGTSGYSGNIGMSGGGDMYFNVSTASVGAGGAVTQNQVVRILNNGNVGIGTTSPGYKLDVSGGAIAIRGNAPGNSLRFDDSGGTSRNAMYVDTSNYLNIGNANYAGVKFVQTASAPDTGAFDGQSVQQAVGTTDEGVVLAAPDAWLAVRVGTTDYAIPMYTTG